MRYRPKRFRTQVLLLFLLAVLLPMIVLSVYLYEDIVTTTETRLENQLETEGSRWLAGYLSRRAQVERLAYMVGNNPTIINFLNSRRVQDADMIKTIRNSFRPMLEWLMTTNEMVYRIHFFTDNPELPEDRFVTQFSSHDKEIWFQEMRAQSARGRLLPARRANALSYETVTEYPLVATYQIRLASMFDCYLQLDISAQWLYGSIPLVVEGSTGEILYSALSDSLEGTQFDLSILEQENGFARTVSMMGQRYSVGRCDQERDGVQFLFLIPTATPAELMRDSLSNYFISGLALGMTMLLLCWLIAARVTRRVDTIGHMVGQITQGQYLVSYTPRYQDEIDRLGQDVREMGEEMDRLVNQGLRQSLLTREAEFRALQAQINPHFIFNTLESFQMLAELEGLKNLSDMMAQLGKLVRYNLEQVPTVPLHMEIGNVTDYVAMQNLNRNDCIRLEVRADEKLMEREVLRLMLQPIVENAIVHGMPLEGILRVVIQVTQEDGKLRLRVSNDGKPVSPDEETRLRQLLHEARRTSVSAESKSIALQNIQRRLIIQYGSQCLIHIGQDDIQGFFVEFVLPERKEP